MTASDVPHIARHLLQEHGLAELGWTFHWDNARKRAGCCRHHRKAVTISRHYAALNVAERPDDVLDTILHEVAHALAGPRHGHDDAWKAVCCRIGARPERCYDSDVIAMPRGRFAASCGGCGREYTRHKVLRPNTWSYCRRCGRERGRLAYTLSASTAATVSVATIDTPPRPTKLR